MEEPIEIDVDPQTGFDMILQAAFDNETQTPESILCLISPASISVSSLLKSDLLALLNSSTVNLQPTTSCMMKVPVRWNTGELLKAPVPPRKWLSDLEIDLKKQWPGVTSVQHPTISGLRLPLWAGNFWWCLVEAVEQREAWSKAKHWISRLLQDAKVYEARDLMDRIPWGTRIWALAGADSSSFVGDLAELLSTNWLRERHLDTLASYFNFYAGKDEMGVGSVGLVTCISRPV